MALDGGDRAMGVMVGGVVLIVVMAGVGTLLARSLGGTPPAAGPPPAPPPTVAVASAFAAKDAKPVDMGPLRFAEPGSADLYVATMKRLGVVRASIADIKATSTDATLDDANARCSAIATDLAVLARESHAGVRAFVDGARKTCEYDLQSALLRVSNERVGAARKGGARAPLAECKRGMRAADALKSHHYEDDPTIAPALATFAGLCTT